MVSIPFSPEQGGGSGGIRPRSRRAQREIPRAQRSSFTSNGRTETKDQRPRRRVDQNNKGKYRAKTGHFPDLPHLHLEMAVFGQLVG